jgi:phosphoenolpyruvate carboxykinase (GTP)
MAAGSETPIGLMPAKGELNLKGIEVSEKALEELFSLDSQTWSQELTGMETFFDSFGHKLPAELRHELELTRRLFESKSDGGIGKAA